MYSLVRIKRGGGAGGPDPLKNHKNIGFLSNTCPDPLKDRKAAKTAFNFGHHRYASETSLASRWWPDFSDIWIHALTKISWIPSDKTFWIRLVLSFQQIDKCLISLFWVHTVCKCTIADGTQALIGVDGGDRIECINIIFYEICLNEPGKTFKTEIEIFSAFLFLVYFGSSLPYSVADWCPSVMQKMKFTFNKTVWQNKSHNIFKTEVSVRQTCL